MTDERRAGSRRRDGAAGALLVLSAIVAGFGWLLVGGVADLAFRPLGFPFTAPPVFAAAAVVAALGLGSGRRSFAFWIAVIGGVVGLFTPPLGIPLLVLSVLAAWCLGGASDAGERGQGPTWIGLGAVAAGIAAATALDTDPLRPPDTRRPDVVGIAVSDGRIVRAACRMAGWSTWPARRCGRAVRGVA